MVSQRWMIGISCVACWVVASCAADDHVEATVEACVDQVITHGSSGGAAGSGGQGGHGGTGFSSECTPETVDKDCADVLPSFDAVCGRRQCVDNKCTLQITPGPIAAQKYGDCKQVVCDNDGRRMEMNDDSDFYNDGNQCTIDYCQSGETHFVLPDGSQCPEAGEGFCYQGQCVECIDIMPQYGCEGVNMMCDAFWCVSLLDCMGKCGGDCAPCAVGQYCAAGSDCISNVCQSGMCQFPTCADGVKNDGETGVDCGAASCAACPAGQGCEWPSDCESGVCFKNICQAATCMDGTQNGDEEGIDCGGAGCDACPEM